MREFSSKDEKEISSKRRRRTWAGGIALAVALARPLVAQTAPSSPPPIQDNSFLVEEAYNQEAGVVQTIQEYTRVSGTGDWAYTLTQEWPVPDLKNQLSFTIPIEGLSGPIGVARGVGDLALNYRYQLVGSGETKVAVAPRATILVPTGDSRRGLGSGGFGLQVNVPLSLVLSERLVAHTNLGATVIFSAKDAQGDRGNLTNVNAGQSLVWLLHPNVNLLLEAVVASDQVLGDTGVKIRRTDAALSPGVRGALNVPGNLQIVGGLAVPIGLGAGASRSLLLYFSVELPFWHPAS